jgi:hypothetical protein
LQEALILEQFGDDADVVQLQQLHLDRVLRCCNYAFDLITSSQDCCPTYVLLFNARNAIDARQLH